MLQKFRNLYHTTLFRFLFVVLIPTVAIFFIHFRVMQYYQIIVIVFMINVILTAGLNLTNGFTGMFSMGQAGFMGIGAYVSSLLTMPAEMKIVRIQGIPEGLANAHLPFALAILVAGLAASLIAVVFAFPVLRSKGHYLAVITLGMIIIIKAFLDNNSPITNGAKGISGMERYSSIPTVFVVMILSLYLLNRLTKSAYGRNMKAIAADMNAAASLGINATKYRLIAFVTSAFFGAVGGSLWAHLQQTIAPSLFYFKQSFSVIEMSVLGGMSSLSGAIPGAAIVTFLPHLLTNVETSLNGLSSILMCVIFIVVVIYRRGGVTGGSEYIVDTLFSKDTYVGLFRKQTYKDFCDVLRSFSKKEKR